MDSQHEFLRVKEHLINDYAMKLRENNAELWKYCKQMQFCFEEILNHTKSSPKPKGSPMYEIHTRARRGHELGLRFTKVLEDKK